VCATHRPVHADICQMAYIAPNVDSYGQVLKRRSSAGWTCIEEESWRREMVEAQHRSNSKRESSRVGRGIPARSTRWPRRAGQLVQARHSVVRLWRTWPLVRLTAIREALASFLAVGLRFRGTASCRPQTWHLRPDPRMEARGQRSLRMECRSTYDCGEAVCVIEWTLTAAHERFRCRTSPSGPGGSGACCIRCARRLWRSARGQVL
jgi:hypothetical protein